MGALRSTGSVFLQWTARRKDAGEVVGVEEAAAAASPEEDSVVCWVFFFFFFEGGKKRRRSDGRKEDRRCYDGDDADDGKRRGRALLLLCSLARCSRLFERALRRECPRAREQQGKARERENASERDSKACDFDVPLSSEERKKVGARFFFFFFFFFFFRRRRRSSSCSCSQAPGARAAPFGLLRRGEQAGLEPFPPLFFFFFFFFRFRSHELHVGARLSGRRRQDFPVGRRRRRRRRHRRRRRKKKDDVR